jgi:hypothetical protein
LVLVEQITDVDSAFEKAANYQKKNEGPTDELTGGEFDLRGCWLCARHESYSFATLYILSALSAVSGRWSKKILCINENPLLSYDKRGGNAYVSIDASGTLCSSDEFGHGKNLSLPRMIAWGRIYTRMLYKSKACRVRQALKIVTGYPKQPPFFLPRIQCALGPFVYIHNRLRPRPRRQGWLANPIPRLENYTCRKKLF